CPGEPPVMRGMPGPDVSWLGEPGSEFTGLLRRPREVLASSVGSCDVLRWNMVSGETTRAADIDAGDPDLRLACKDRELTLGDVEFGEWLGGRDTPVMLFDLGDSYMVDIRRAQRAGWTLIEFDASGRRLSRIDLPWEAVPLGANKS